MIPVAILGGSGYTAVELIKILLRHPGVEIAAVTSRREETPASLRVDGLHVDHVGSRKRVEAFEATLAPHQRSRQTSIA